MTRRTLTKTKLGNCVRHVTPTPAVTEQVVAFGHGKYRLLLCDECADLMLDQFFEWARTGELVDEFENATFKPSSTTSEPRRRGRGRVLRRGGPELELPVISRVAQEEAPEQEAPLPMVRPRRSEPINGDRWVWTDHAIERFNQRTEWAERLGLEPLTKDDVLWCAELPKRTHPGDDAQYPGLLIHVREHVHLVLDPSAHKIVTIKDLRITMEQEQELELQSA